MRAAPIGEVARWTPEGPTRDGVFRARGLGIAFVASATGTGGIPLLWREATERA